MTCDCIDDIPGAAGLRDWFGGFPSFHDAYAQLQLSGDGAGWIKLRGARMTAQVDADGYYISEKHFAALISLGEIVSVSLSDFMPGEMIVGRLNILRKDAAFELDIDTAYGLAGTIVARRVEIEFVPLPAGSLRDVSVASVFFRKMAD